MMSSDHDTAVPDVLVGSVFWVTYHLIQF